MIRNHHEGDSDEAQVNVNRVRLEANRTNADVLPGPAREGLALLQGMLVCGSCGRRMSIRYTGNGGINPVYGCNTRPEREKGKQCRLSFAAGPVDRAFADLLGGEGRKSTTGKKLNASMISWVRWKHRIAAPVPPDDNTLNVRQVAERYQ